jgi:hypothetical protein
VTGRAVVATMIVMVLIILTGCVNAFVTTGYASDRIGLNVSIEYVDNGWIGTEVSIKNWENVPLMIDIIDPDIFSVVGTIDIQPLGKERIPQRYIDGSHLITGIQLRCGSLVNGTSRIRGIPGSNSISYIEI